MTPEQIKDLIAQTIAGQGNQVDSGGKLADILDAIVDLASAGANVQSDWNENNNTDPSFIKNKPTIPAAQVQSDWLQENNLSVEHIANRPALKFALNELTGGIPIADKTALSVFLRLLSIYVSNNGELMMLPRCDSLVISSAIQTILRQKLGQSITVYAIWGTIESTVASASTIATKYTLCVAYGVSSQTWVKLIAG